MIIKADMNLSTYDVTYAPVFLKRCNLPSAASTWLVCFMLRDWYAHPVSQCHLSATLTIVSSAKDVASLLVLMGFVNCSMAYLIDSSCYWAHLFRDIRPRISPPAYWYPAQEWCWAAFVDLIMDDSSSVSSWMSCLSWLRFCLDVIGWLQHVGMDQGT